MHYTQFLETIGNIHFLVATGVAVVAGFMRGFVGAGSGMLMAPVFAIIFGPLETVATIVLLELVVTAQLLPSVVRLVEWRVIVPMSTVAAMFMPVGMWLLVSINAELMTRGIACVVLIFVLLLLTGFRYEGPKRLGYTLGVGTVSGTLLAATGIGNPPVMLYFLSSTDSAAINRANFTGYFSLTLVALVILMSVSGLISSSSVARTAFLLPVFVTSAWYGARCFRKANDKLYRQVALGLLLCVALYGILR